MKREEENDNRSDNRNDNRNDNKNDIKNELRKFISPNAEAMIAGSDINSLGKEIL